MKKYTIRIQRVEYYNHDVEVDAESAADAIAEVERRNLDGEFYDLLTKHGPVYSEDEVCCESEATA